MRCIEFLGDFRVAGAVGHGSPEFEDEVDGGAVFEEFVDHGCWTTL